jgi:hypothetical protein
MKGSVADNMVIVRMGKDQKDRSSTLYSIHVLFDGKHFVWEPGGVYYNYDIIRTDNRGIGLKKGTLKNRNI